MHNCPSCSRRVPLNRDTCLYCGTPVPPPPKERYYLKCPRCSASLDEELVDGLMLDICHSCGGTWYDKHELEARLQHGLAHETVLAPHEERTAHLASQCGTPGKVEYLLCPHCQKPMVPKNFGRNSGVIVDICGYHGIFLDTGEFDRLLAFEEQGGSQKAQELEERHARMRAREAKRDEQAQRRRSSDYALAHRRFLPFFLRKPW